MDRTDLEYLREVMRRSDQRFAQAAARWERQAERRHQEYMANFRELQEESRAQRAALFALIDRLNGGGAQPAT